MNVTSIATPPTTQKKVSFTGSQQQSKRQYIDRQTESRIGLGSFIGNIAGSTTLGAFLFKKVAGPIEGIKGFQALPTKVKAIALAASTLGTLAIGFIGGKIAGNWGKSEGEKPSNAAVAKLTAASLAGLTAGSVTGSWIGSKLGGGGFAFITEALGSVFGSDGAVKIASSIHNNKAEKPPEPKTVVFNTQQGPIVVQDFRQFIAKTQSMN